MYKEYLWPNFKKTEEIVEKENRQQLDTEQK